MPQWILALATAPMMALIVDYDSTSKNHVLSLMPDRIIRIEATEDGFDPAEFITWNTSRSPWFIPRNWGLYS